MAIQEFSFSASSPLHIPTYFHLSSYLMPCTILFPLSSHLPPLTFLPSFPSVYLPPHIHSHIHSLFIYYYSLPPPSHIFLPHSPSIPSCSLPLHLCLPPFFIPTLYQLLCSSSISYTLVNKLYKEEKEEEERVKMAENSRYKQYKRYMRNNKPGRITFIDE